jgi:hypothetical protein
MLGLYHIGVRPCMHLLSRLADEGIFYVFVYKGGVQLGTAYRAHYPLGKA